MKTMTLKIVFSFYSRHWKIEVSYFIRENYVMDQVIFEEVAKEHNAKSCAN